MKKPITPKQLEAIRKKYANRGEDDIGVEIVERAESQPPEDSKEHCEESA
jgi:hypothetical protein